MNVAEVENPEARTLLGLLGLGTGSLQEPHWDNVISLAVNNGVTSHLHAALMRLQEPPAGAETARMRLQERAKRKVFRSLYLRRELARLLSVFASAGIPVIPLKGPVLADMHYRDPSLREFGDLDLLVAPERLEEARALFERSGYHSPYKNCDLHLRYQIIYQNAESSECVELHWRIAGPQYGRYHDGAYLWTHLEEKSWCGLTLSMPRVECQLLYLAIHAYKHDWGRLQWLWDIPEVLGANPQFDWDFLLQIAREQQALRLTVATLQLAKRLFPSMPSPPVGHPLDRMILSDAQMRCVWGQICDPVHASSPVTSFLKLRVSLADTWSGRARLVQSRLTPSDRDREVLNLPAALRPLYVFIRPFRLLGKYMQQKRGKGA